MKALFFSALLIIPCAAANATGLPLMQLPKNVPVLEGQLTLYADYEKTKGGEIPLYVINATKLPVTFEAQDVDVYLKLEYKNEKGEWKRAQSHLFKCCGFSYFYYHKRVEAGTFMKVSGLSHSQPYRCYSAYTGLVKTERAELRYRCYGSHDIISNAGTGFYDPMAALASEWDEMALKGAPFKKLRKVALGKAVIPKAAKGGRYLRLYAMYLMLEGKFDMAQMRESMQTLSKDIDPEVKKRAEEILESWKEKAADKDA